MLRQKFRPSKPPSIVFIVVFGPNSNDPFFLCASRFFLYTSSALLLVKCTTNSKYRCFQFRKVLRPRFHSHPQWILPTMRKEKEVRRMYGRALLCTHEMYTLAESGFTRFDFSASLQSYKMSCCVPSDIPLLKCQIDVQGTFIGTRLLRHIYQVLVRTKWFDLF